MGEIRHRCVLDILGVQMAVYALLMGVSLTTSSFNGRRRFTRVR